MSKTPTGIGGTTNSGRGQRELRVRVKTAKGRKISSTRWLERQLNDPYVQRAKKEGYRGRAAYKILELDDKFRFLFLRLVAHHIRGAGYGNLVDGFVIDVLDFDVLWWACHIYAFCCERMF